MSTAVASATVTTTPVKIYGPVLDGKCHVMRIMCFAGSAADLLVRQDGINAAGEYQTIEPGGDMVIASRSTIGDVYVRSDVGTATYSFGKVG